MARILFFLVLVVLPVIVRRTSIAVGLVAMLAVATFPPTYSNLPLHAVTMLLIVSTSLVLLFRYQNS